MSNLLNLRCVLLSFQVVSGLKINVDKSKLIRIGGNGDAGMFASVLGCKAINLPIKYLGIPLGAKYKDLVSWESVLKLFEKKLAGWKHNFLSKGGRFTSIKSIMVNLPIYYLSTLTIPVKIAKKLEKI